MVIRELGKIKADKYSDAFYPMFSLTNIQKQILSHFGLGKADYDNLIGNLCEQNFRKQKKMMKPTKSHHLL